MPNIIEITQQELDATFADQHAIQSIYLSEADVHRQTALARGMYTKVLEQIDLKYNVSKTDIEFNIISNEIQQFINANESRLGQETKVYALEVLNSINNAHSIETETQLNVKELLTRIWSLTKNKMVDAGSQGLVIYTLAHNKIASGGCLAGIAVRLSLIYYNFMHNISIKAIEDQKVNRLMKEHKQKMLNPAPLSLAEQEESNILDALRLSQQEEARSSLSLAEQEESNILYALRLSQQEEARSSLSLAEQEESNILDALRLSQQEEARSSLSLAEQEESNILYALRLSQQEEARSSLSLAEQEESNILDALRLSQQEEARSSLSLADHNEKAEGTPSINEQDQIHSDYVFALSLQEESDIRADFQFDPAELPPLSQQKRNEAFVIAWSNPREYPGIRSNYPISHGWKPNSDGTIPNGDAPCDWQVPLELVKKMNTISI